MLHYKELLKTADINFVYITKGVDGYANSVTILQSRAEQSRAEQSRAEQSRAGVSCGLFWDKTEYDDDG
ncbi:hypothetical protein [Lachnospira sp.]|uniref:hypothetical protein n=1 Tax=Lachnospira sp. TaxID=2049031 RepID=UPI002579F6DA|nr:hypothetical protein [Lachnospira sp.]